MGRPWWKGAVLYQIYPRSFLDTHGDGIGDLRGITERLDHVAKLGVDAVWVSPFFASPMRDFGYDVSDYRAVDPMFGTLDDFDALVDRAHALGLRVIIDQVLSHTSDEHAWFRESRRDAKGPKADWYVWADARDDGTPPNNWLSVFGGPAWEWDVRRGQYYLHNFLSSQPDLNLHRDEVRAALLGEVQFWLDRGVDGFRFDAINFSFHDALLRDNPPVPREGRGTGLAPGCNPYAFQQHVYNANRPEVVDFLREIRTLLDRHEQRRGQPLMAVGEIGERRAETKAAQYTQPGRLHMVYTFALLGDRVEAEHLRELVQAQEDALEGEGWMCWTVGNHDAPRVASRWGGAQADPRVARLALVLVTTLRGSPCLYQGDELGLPEAKLRYEDLQDPYGQRFWPEFEGRDGCRTPMPWVSGEAHGGFTTGRPWLPVPQEHLERAVDRQAGEEGSMLEFTRAWLAWRCRWPVLLEGAFRFVDAPEGVLAFERGEGDERLVVWLNLRDAPVTIEVGEGMRDVGAPGSTTLSREGRSELAAYGFAVVQVAKQS